jgi:tetratricopeptide (TPR) repeat protein
MTRRKRKPAPTQPADSVDDELGFRRRRTALRVRRKPGEKAWELVHPRCALERGEDLEEVQQMVDGGEIDVAVDELRWLLNGCSDFVAAHRLLGELALADGDLNLARGHFGYAYEIGLSACPPCGLDAPLPYRLSANRAFLEAAKGLAWCLHELGKRKRARRVLEQLLSCDPTDPLTVRPWQDAWMREDAPGGEAE